MSLKNSEEKMLKYKLQDILDNLAKWEHSKVIALIPKITGKCMNTIYGYARIPYGATRDIPYSVVRKLEIYFGLKHGGLCNFDITGSHYRDLI